MINLIPFKQFISAGHHDNDPGAVANGYQENELTKELRNIILKHGNSKEIIIDKTKKLIANIKIGLNQERVLWF